MAAEAGIRLLDHLPALYRADDGDSDLARLLGVFEELLFHGSATPDGLPGIERELRRLPAVFAPLGIAAATDAARTPQRFLPWLATWLAFAAHALVEPARLRHVVAGIVPLYGLRGTRPFMEALLPLCFEEIAAARVDDGEMGGLRVGVSTLGIDSVLSHDRPFWFRVDVVLADASRPHGPGAARFEQRLRAVIDFAKPAHTAYELRVRRGAADATGIRE